MSDIDLHTRPSLTQPGRLTDSASMAAELAEPLQAGAMEAFRTAQELCPGCRAYHGLWPYMRMGGFVRAMQIDGSLFVDAAERFAAAGQLDTVLISGCADYSMLAHLAHGAARAGRRAAFDVIDVCGTTLRMNEWYARREGIEVRTFRGSIHDFQPDRSYDLICTHSFLPFHTVEQRPNLFRQWSRMLSPRGRLCLSNRISPEPIPFDLAERRARIAGATAKVLDRLREQEIPLPCSEDEFAALMREYGDLRKEDYAALSLDMFEELVEQAGLTLELALVIADVLPGPADTTVLHGDTRGRPRMWFQARRT